MNLILLFLLQKYPIRTRYFLDMTLIGYLSSISKKKIALKIFMNVRPGILIYSKNEDYLYGNPENTEITH